MKKAGVSSILFVVILLAVGVIAEAQQPKKIPRIGYLSNLESATESARAEAIRQALRERGYIEGQNIAIEYRYAEGKPDRLPELAAELVRLKVDIIVVAGGSPMIQAAKNATKTIPIVMSGGSDPVEAGLVESLARPGGNVTGLTNLNRELGGKRLELFKEAVPKVARVAVLYDPAIPAQVLDVKEVLPVAARALKLTIQPWEVRGTDDFERVFAALNKQRPDGLYPTGGPLMNANGKNVDEIFGLKPRYNIAPTQEAPVIIQAVGKRTLELFRWGLIPWWAKDPAIGNEMINARAETLTERPAFKHLLGTRRCLVLADGFYEWRKEGKDKVPMRFKLKSGESFAFAGLWDSWKQPDGNLLRTYTIVTT